MSPDSRVAMLLALMGQLQEVMRTENGLLRDLKLARLRDLQSEKSALATHFELELRRLRETPAVLAALDDAARRMLEERMRGFQRSARANAERLKSAHGLVEALVQTLGRELAAEPAMRYAGGTSPAGGTPRVVAIAFDRRC